MNTVNGASIKIPNDATGNIVHEFSHLLSQYNSGIQNIHTSNHMAEYNTHVDMELRFWNEDMFKSFMHTTTELHERDKREEELREEFPALRRAYEEYQTMVKLYGS